MPEEFPTGETLNDDFWLDEPDRFVGRVDSITVRPMSVGDELQDRIVVEIHNLLYNSTALIFFSPSKRPNSKWGRWRKAIVDVGVSAARTEDVIGTHFIFERQDWSFGGDFVARGVPTPVEFLEAANAEERASLMAAELGIEIVAEDEAMPDLTAEEEFLLNLVCGAIHDKSYDGFLQAVVQIDDIVTNPEYMSLLVDPQRAYVNSLVEQGYLTLGEDGVYQAHFAE